LLEIIHDSKEEIDFYEKKSIAKFEWVSISSLGIQPKHYLSYG
jgi:hypothetical protein